VKILMAWDQEFRVLWVVILDSNDSSNNDTIIFHEPSNRWVSFVDLWASGPAYLHSIIGVSGGLYSWRSSILSKHNDDSVNRCLIYNDAKTQEVEVVLNADPGVNKVYKALGIHPDKGAWSIPDDDGIEIPATDTYPNGMASRIKAAKFRNREGIRYAEFGRDLNTPGKSGVDALINGRPLRGKTMTIRLENTDTDEVNLLGVEYEYADS